MKQLTASPLLACFIAGDFLPSFADSHGCNPVNKCEEGIFRSLGEG